MPNGLKQYFPMIWERDEVLDCIRGQKALREIFETWDERKQEELLSLILNDRVKILKVLPNESTRIAAEKSLLIMDIVVELKDRSIANVEVQRIGYAFPGQRSACYSADLLLRQYKRVKGERGKKFSYRDIKKVYTIVFFEKSSGPFLACENHYIHHMKQKSDTGIELELLQEFSFICLDIFRKNQHNKSDNIENRMEAWLTFLSADDPETIVKLLEQYPEFEALYREVYGMCRNLEDMMGLFSEELAILDENTVQYMIDEMQDVIDEQKDVISKQKNQLEQKDIILKEQANALEMQEKEIERLRELLNH